MAGFPRRLVVLVCYDFLAYLKPQLGRDETLAGGQHQHLTLQILSLVLGVPFTAIVVAAVGSCEVGGIVVNLRSLAFEKLVNIQVSHDIDGIAEDGTDCPSGEWLTKV